MESQRSLFSIPSDVHYLNGAYMSPLMKSVEEAGIIGMQRKRNPVDITADDFFEEADIIRLRFGQLINASPSQIAIIPSVSYGLTSAISNLPTNKGKKVIIVSDEFPADYYVVSRWCQQHNKELAVLNAPGVTIGRADAWNQNILAGIDQQTTAVVMSSIHWTDGTLFDLKLIGQRCKEAGALFIVDGTQSIGAMPIDVQACGIDALICAAYKWLLGPYSIALAYYSEAFNDGLPIEEAWVNRSNARNFSSLTQYSSAYTPGAGRYNMGEYANFTLIPMLNKGLEQIQAWGVENIQAYSKKLMDPLASFLRQQEYKVEERGRHADHLIGIGLPAHLEIDQVISHLKEKNIIVSRRGNSIRVSIHVYNEEADIHAMQETLHSSM